MAMTYNLNPAPLIPAGDTPQARYQSGMGLGRVNPFATSTMMPSSPMARTNYLEPTMAAIAARTRQPLQTPTSVAMPTAPLARTSRVPVPQARPVDMPKTPPSGLDQLRAAQLRMPAKGSPALAGMGAAAATGLQLSGYQDRPLTTGQIAGSMLQSFNEAADVTRQRQGEADAQQREIEQQAFANTIKLMELEAQGIKAQRELAQQESKSEEEKIKDVAKYTNELADDFRAENKEFTSAFTSFRKIAMTDPDDATGADDIALIFNYMKVLDPNSVVRESEFGLAAQSGSFGQTIMAAYQQIQSGQKLTPTQRRYFIESAQAQFAPYVELRNRTENRYGQRADQLGVDRSNVFDSVVGGESYLPRIVTTLEEGEGLPSGTYFTVRGSGETRRVE